MKSIRFSPELIKKLKEISLKNPKLYKKIQTKLSIFSQNPRHPSLRHHKLERQVENTFSISINMNIRMIFIETEDIYSQKSFAYFFDIGTHDEVYK